MNIYNPPFDDQNQPRIAKETVACQNIFKYLQENQFYLAWSFILAYENDLNPAKTIKSEIKRLAQIAKYTITPSPQILAKATDFEKAGIKSMDALHLACAEVHLCDYFITCDDKLIKKASNMTAHTTAYNPINFINKVIQT